MKQERGLHVAFRSSIVFLSAVLFVMTGFLSGCSDSSDDKDSVVQASLDARSKDVITVDSFEFKDLNNNGKLDTYEDWRAPIDERIDDLVSQMTLEEKAGMMMIDTLGSDLDGALPNNAADYVNSQHMTRFIFRNTVTGDPADAVSGGGWGASAEVSPAEAATFMNSMQQLAESTRLGIPVLFKSNARNHYTHDARAGVNVAAGSFSEWPKEAGLAATRDMDLIAQFGQTMAAEWTSIGLRGMYGYMADLATEPRWFRVHETFTEDADLAADIMGTLVKNIQGAKLGAGSVMLTMKHFPGGGPQLDGADPHYDFGKNQAYPANNFAYHLKPFRAAIDSGVAAIMPYYGIPVNQAYYPNDVGMSFSRGIVTDLLRGELGFEGVVNSDTGIIVNQAWGLEDLTEEQRIFIAIDAGVDVLSGYHDNAKIMSAIGNGYWQVPESRVDESVKRLLKVQFELGLFENPYVDPAVATATVGKAAFRELGMEAQRKSVVLLKNTDDSVLPLPPADDLNEDGTAGDKVTLFTMGMNPDVVSDAEWGSYAVIDGDTDGVAAASGANFAVIRVTVDNSGHLPYLFYGGANPDELSKLSFSSMTDAASWKMTPSLADINTVMAAVGAENTVISIYFRQPYVIDDASGVRAAGALVATFGVSDNALMDVLTGVQNPQGKLPFALANNLQAVIDQDEDAPGYPSADTLYPFGHGLSYPMP